MRRSTLPLAVVAMVLASAAWAQLSPSFAEFPKSPAGFLMTAAEQKAFAELKTDAEAQSFIDLFWAKRDTNPDTVFNEAKADFDSKVAAADKQFAYPGGKGSLTDRAKVFYIMGVPSAPIEAKAAMPMTEDIVRGASQTWKYAKVQLPKSDDDFVKFYFVESKAGAGDYVLDPKDKRNKEALKVLAERQEKLILRPKLTEVPRAGLVTGTKAATSAQLAVLSQEPKPWPDGAEMYAVSGVLSDSVHPLWVHVELPDAIAPATQAVGRVIRKDGTEVGSFFTPVTAESMPGARSYEFSIPIEAGEYKVEIGLLSDTGTLAVHSAEVTSEAIPADTTYISPMYSGITARQEPAKIGSPFNVGGWRVVLRVNNKFSPSEEITYFAYIVNPGFEHLEGTGCIGVAPADPKKGVEKDGAVDYTLRVETVSACPEVRHVTLKLRALDSAGLELGAVTEEQDLGPNQTRIVAASKPISVDKAKTIAKTEVSFEDPKALPTDPHFVPQPKYTMDFKLFVNGKPAGARTGNPVTLSKVGEKVYMWGSGLPLTNFKNPGEYKLEITLNDTVTKVSRTTPILVVIPGAAAPAAAPAPAK